MDPKRASLRRQVPQVDDLRATLTITNLTEEVIKT